MGTFQRSSCFYTVQTEFSIPLSLTLPARKPTPYRKLSSILDFQNTSLCVNYKLFSSWGPKSVPTRSEYPGISILTGTFGPHNVGNTSTHRETLLYYIIFVVNHQ